MSGNEESQQACAEDCYQYIKDNLNNWLTDLDDFDSMREKRTIMSACGAREEWWNSEYTESEAEELYNQAAVEYTEYCERYEPTYNPDDGSM